MGVRRVVIVDDHPEMRALARTLLEAAGCVVVGEAADGDDAEDRTRALEPDVVVLYWEMPERTGYDALPEIRRACPAARIIMFSSRDARDAGPDAIAAGADLYLEKSDWRALVAAITEDSPQRTDR